MDRPGSDQHAVDAVSGTGGVARRLGMRLVWAAAYAIGISLAVIMALLPAGDATLPSIMWRRMGGLRGAGQAPPSLSNCPRINYSEPACHLGLLHPPAPDRTDAEVLEDMYHAFKCLQKAIVDPWSAAAAAERRQSLLRGWVRPSGGSRRYRCGREGAAADNRPPSPFDVSQEDAWRNGWRAQAEQQLCTVADSMYHAMTSCRHGLRRGMYIHSSGELLIRLSTERRCPAGLAVCAVVKDEAAYIQEWLAFHLHSGVQHFYLYLNGNEDGTMTALKPFVDAGFVTVETIEGAGTEGEASDRCLRRVKQGRLADWIALIDVDEYLFLGDHGCMMDYLQHLDDRAALTVNWRTYSLSNNILPVPPDRLLIESNVYTRADDAENVGMDRRVKSIVHVNRTASCRGAHHCIYEEGWSAKDEWGHVVEGPSNSYLPNESRVRLHYYHTRSYADFLMERLRRGRASSNDAVLDFDYVFNNLRMAARMASVGEDIQPAVGPVRRILSPE